MAHLGRFLPRPEPPDRTSVHHAGGRAGARVHRVRCAQIVSRPGDTEAACGLIFLTAAATATRRAAVLGADIDGPLLLTVCDAGESHQLHALLRQYRPVRFQVACCVCVRARGCGRGGSSESVGGSTALDIIPWPLLLPLSWDCLFPANKAQAINCACTCARAYTCVYLHARAHVCTCTRGMCTYVCVPVCIRSRACVCVRVRACTCVCVHVRACTCDRLC